MIYMWITLAVLADFALAVAVGKIIHFGNGDEP